VGVWFVVSEICRRNVVGLKDKMVNARWTKLNYGALTFVFKEYSCKYISMLKYLACLLYSQSID